MSEMNLNELTVIELRKLAKERHVTLKAGISKQGIIERLTEAMNADGGQPAEAVPEAPQAAEEAPADDAPEKPVETEDKPAAPEKAAADAPAPGFRQSSAAPRFNTRPAYQAPAYSSRSAAPRPTVEPQRTQTTRPVGFTPRFGPAASAEASANREAPAQREGFMIRETSAYREAPAVRDASPAREMSAPREEERFSRPETPRPSYPMERRPAYGEARSYPARSNGDAPQRPAAERPGFDRPGADRPAPEQRPAQEHRPSASEMLTPAECPEGSGVLEMYPEGYGFLRTGNLVPTAKDIFVAASQVRRFGLRAGDQIVGRVRPMRDGDKYAAMLYLTSVNGAAPDALAGRPAIEDLTAVYPNRRICLTEEDGQTPEALRFLDLLAPIGFGQRGLILCPPGGDHRKLLAHLANAIHRNHPEAQLSMLLFNETPEEITELRDEVACPVLASTFDMQPEHHLRLSDLAVETANRAAEAKRDAILLVDSLTALSRIVTASAMQQGRQQPGTLSPASLQKARRLFGAARCLREGGSLTVIAVMHVDPVGKTEDAIIGDFRAAANMTYTLGEAKGDAPVVSLSGTGSKRAEAITAPAQQECLKILSSAAHLAPADQIAADLAGMLKEADSMEALAERMRNWADALKN